MSRRSSCSVDLQAEVELPQPRRSATRSGVRRGSLLSAALEVVDGRAGPPVLGCRSAALRGVAAGPGASSSCCVVVSFEEHGRVEAVIAGALGAQLVSQCVRGRWIGQPVLPGEVVVVLVEGVVVGGLGVWAEGSGAFAEELGVVGEVVAFAVGGDGGGCGVPGAGVGGVVGPGAEGAGVGQEPVVVCQVGTDLVPALADEVSGSPCKLVVRVAGSGGWEGVQRSWLSGGFGVFGDLAEPPVQDAGGRVGVVDGSHVDGPVGQLVGVVSLEGVLAGAVEQAAPLGVADGLAEPAVVELGR